MAIRNIVKEGDPILNKVCRPVTNFRGMGHHRCTRGDPRGL